MSSPFLTEYDSVSISQSFLKYAKVTLSCEGDSEILTLYRQTDFFPPFVYKSIRMKGKTGGTYRLTVETLGRTITATTTIPEAPAVDGLKLEAKSDTAGYLKLFVRPSETQKLRLFIQVKSQFDDRHLHPAMSPVYLLTPSENMTEVYVYRSNETNLYLLNTKAYFYRNYPRYQYSPKDTILVQAGAIDNTSYQVLKSLFADQSMRINPFAFNTAGIQTNIVGGIGRWTGIGEAPLQIYRGK